MSEPVTLTLLEEPYLDTHTIDPVVADTSGNLLTAVGLTGGSVQTAGAPAEYTITQNGTTTATQYSNTNSVTNALPGVNLTFTGEGSANITVAQDTSAASDSPLAPRFNTQQKQKLLDADKHRTDATRARPRSTTSGGSSNWKPKTQTFTTEGNNQDTGDNAAVTFRFALSELDP